MVPRRADTQGMTHMSVPVTPPETPHAGGPVRVGDQAPDFTLPNQQGTLVSLHELIARGPVVVFFYPKDDWTPVNIGV